MKTFTVNILTDAVNDMQEGRRFYERQDPVLGNYFWDSITADLESLQVYGGIHSKKLGFYRMIAKRFPFAIYLLRYKKRNRHCGSDTSDAQKTRNYRRLTTKPVKAPLPRSTQS